MAGGEEITEDIAQKIEDSPIESVEIRSVLTCESKKGVLAECLLLLPHPRTWQLAQARPGTRFLREEPLLLHARRRRILSIACFSKSSKRFEDWLYHTKLYQTYVADFRETKSIARERKKKIIVSIYILMGISIYFAPLLPVKIALGCLTVFITYYLFKVCLLYTSRCV